MANINKNLGLMDDPDEFCRKSKGSVQTALKSRDLEEESKDFFKAQLDMTKDFLPKETMAQKGTTVDNDILRLDLFSQQIHRNDDFSSNADLKDGKMMTDPVTAYNAVYPSGNPVPVSPNTKPTSSIADDHKGGYRGDESVPQNYIGSIQLEYKSGAAVPIGDNYLPDGAWNGKDKVKPPQIQQSSSSEANKMCNAKESPVSINVGSLIEQALIKTNKNMNSIDMSSAIASTKEKKILERPFCTPNAKSAYAVFVKKDAHIVRVNFDAQAAEDVNSLGPKWESKYWAAQVNTAKADSDAPTLTLNQLSDFYYENNYKSKEEPWDGYSFYSEKDILASMPELKLAPSVYTLNIPTNKGAATPSDTKFNSEVKEQLDAAAEKNLQI